MELSNTNAPNGNMHKGGGLLRIYNIAKPTLQLSADQESKIDTVLNTFKATRQTIKSSGAVNQDDLQAARKQTRQQVMAILTPEQKKIWRDNIDTWRAQLN